MLKLRYRKTTEVLGEKWDYCVWCGPQSIRSILHFDSGSSEPTVGETVTGATSGDTGVLAEVNLVTGSWAGGDAAGVFVLNTLTGSSINDKCNAYVFSDDENLNGSTTGNNFATANGAGSVTRTGIMYPESDLVFYRGKNYCRPHFEWRYKTEFIDDQKLKDLEGDRGK